MHLRWSQNQNPTTPAEISISSTSQALSRSRIPVSLWALIYLSTPRSEFTSHFSPYGQISHAVILATPDSNSRRRGFVVFERHEDAKAALEASNGKQPMEIGGQVLTVSWAAVQRSKGNLFESERTELSSQNLLLGFLDGADRIVDALTVPPLLPNDESTLSLRSSTLAPTLLITNLPTSLFSSLSDLDGLLRPFGFIVNVVFIPSTPISDSPFTPKTTSVLVSYTLLDEASEAKAYLDDEVYDGCKLRVDWTPSSQSQDRPVHYPTSQKAYGSKYGLSQFAGSAPQRPFFPIQYHQQLYSPQFPVNSNYAHSFAFANNHKNPTGFGVPQDRSLPHPRPVLYTWSAESRSPGLGYTRKLGPPSGRALSHVPASFSLHLWCRLELAFAQL